MTGNMKLYRYVGPDNIRTRAANAPLGVLRTTAGIFVSMSDDGQVWRFDPTG